MGFMRRMFFFFLINILVVLMASVLGTIIVQALGIKGEWGFYLVFYSLIGFGGAFFSLAMSRVFAKKFMGVRVLNPRTAVGEEKELVNLVHEMAMRAKLPEKPEVGVYESESPNAFATGPSKRKSLVAVSSGLLRSMNKNELEGVIAHEVAHIVNGDMVTMTLLQGLINTMVLLAARFVAQLIASRMRSRSFFMEYFIFIALQIAFGILGSLVLNYFSKKREFRADKGGARFAGRDNMISALKALERLLPSSRAFAHSGGRGTKTESYNYLQISGKKAKGSVFSTHPPLQERIARLERL